MRTRRPERTSLGLSPPGGESGKPEHAGEMAPPPGRDRDLTDGGAVMGVHHPRGRDCDGAVLCRQMLAEAEEQHVTGLEDAALNLDEMPPRGLDERVVAARLGPVRRVRRRRRPLLAYDGAPNPAQQPETVATDALERGLMMVGRADPAPRLCDDALGSHLNKLPPSIRASP